MNVAIVGASGRMGRALVRLASDSGAQVVGAVVSAGSTSEGRDVGELAGIGALGVLASADVSSALLGADVVVDFSSAAGLRALLPLARRARVPVVSGTTRLDAACEAALAGAERDIAVLWSPNTSLGVHLLAELVRRAAARLGEDFDVEIVEAHHRAKVDAPSGTAGLLERAVREGRGEGDGNRAPTVHGREGLVGGRGVGEIGVHAVRGGDIIGDHHVHFLGGGERLELTHRATNRDLFARGALRAARWLVGRPPGRYAMRDVLA